MRWNSAANAASCRDKLRVLQELGLGYLTLGEATPSLSGGEAQRLKLAGEMGKAQSDSVFVFDEPTVGLHPLNVQTLLGVFRTLIANGATVIVIEHDLTSSALRITSSIWGRAAARRRPNCRRRDAVRRRLLCGERHGQISAGSLKRTSLYPFRP